MTALDEVFRRPSPNLEVDLEQLREMVLAIDEEMQREGIPVSFRPIHLGVRLSKRLNSRVLFNTPTQRAAQKILESLYPAGNLALPSTYLGAYLFRGVIYKLGMRTVLGRATLDLDLFLVDMPPERRRQLREDPATYGIYVDQCCDVADISLGFEDLRARPLPAIDAMSRLESGFAHLQAAAAAIANQVSRDGVMHMIFLSAEVLLKGALIAAGSSDKDMKRIGHDHAALIGEFARLYPTSDSSALSRSINFLPKSVHERYDHVGYSNEQAGLSIMALQFIGGEVVRALTSRNLRLSLKWESKPYSPPRFFP